MAALPAEPDVPEEPELPLPDADGIVGVRLWDAKKGERDGRAMHDFLAWRGRLRTIADLGAVAQARRNLITDDGVGEPIDVVPERVRACRSEDPGLPHRAAGHASVAVRALDQRR